jgi:hypothetical protein
MKLAKSIQIKDTVSLFSNKYQYKIVVVCPLATWFRNSDFESVITRLEQLDLGQKPMWAKIKGPEDIEFTRNLNAVMSGQKDFNLRVEHPYLNFYTNDTKSIEQIAAVDPSRIRYISIPNKSNPGLQTNSVICKKIDFGYKVFLGKTTQNYSNFVEWAKTSSNVKLTKRAEKDLGKDRSYGGSYLYVKSDKALTMVKVYIGSSISKVESVIKA